jgi:hypothetical protein
MINEQGIQRKRKELVVAYFKALSRSLPGGNEKKHERTLSEYPISGQRFESGTSRIISAVTFGVECNP